MREFICLMGPAMLMVLMVQILSKRKAKIAELLMQFILYMVLNNMCVILLLGPIHKVGMILGEHGEMTLYYGGVAILTSIAVAIVLSFLIVKLKKNLYITLKCRESIGEENV